MMIGEMMIGKSFDMNKLYLKSPKINNLAFFVLNKLFIGHVSINDI